MKQEDVITDDTVNRMDPILKHVIAIILCFIGIPFAIVFNKLGFHDFAKLILMLVMTLFIWATGLWHIFIGIFKLVLQGITIIP